MEPRRPLTHDNTMKKISAIAFFTGLGILSASALLYLGELEGRLSAAVSCTNTGEFSVLHFTYECHEMALTPTIGTEHAN